MKNSETLDAYLAQFTQARLTIELVPKTCWFSNLRNRVTPPIWDKLRRETAQQAHHHCEICGGQGPRWPVECHEIWYYDDDRYIQRLVGLTALCPACHEVKHIGLAGVRGRAVIAKQHLAKVNGWSDDTAELYIEYAFLIWQQRSNYNWQLDLSWAHQRKITVNMRADLDAKELHY
jgi:hypothetical protein